MSCRFYWRGLFACAIIASCACTGSSQNPQHWREIRGTVEQLRPTPGDSQVEVSMVSEYGERWKVWLGPARRLIERDLAPAVGEQLVVKGSAARLPVQELVARYVRFVDRGRSIWLPPD